MILIIKANLKKIGIDKAIAYTSLGRIIQAFGGIIAIFFVAKYLTGVEQGFYYTFGSLVAIQIFFELGLNGIITQYVAYEVSHLTWKDSTTLIGEHKYLSRLSSLLHFSLKWYSFFAIVLLVTLLIIGFSFFSKYGDSENVNWQIPWCLLSIGTTINLLLAPILAFLEGLGKVKEVAQVRFVQQTVGIIVILGGLYCGFGLFVSGLNWLIGIVLCLILLGFGHFKTLLKNIWNVRLEERVDYMKEIFPYQWKIALSWVSGYFIFQLFNPVLFATEGAVVAGQMGMTLAALNGIQALTQSWMTTKIPLFSTCIAKKEFQRLDGVFTQALKQSVFLNIIGVCCLFLGVFLVRYFSIEINGFKLGDRFLGYLPLLFMIIPTIRNQFVSSWAIYLRCHKQEPLLLNSIVSGILCCLSTLILGKWFGVLGITGGYCAICLILTPWAYFVFRKSKLLWHN